MQTYGFVQAERRLITDKRCESIVRPLLAGLCATFPRGLNRMNVYCLPQYQTQLTGLDIGTGDKTRSVEIDPDKFSLKNSSFKRVRKKGFNYLRNGRSCHFLRSSRFRRLLIWDWLARAVALAPPKRRYAKSNSNE